MARYLSNEELTHLTIPRLQALLKAARARVSSISFCDCCGESLVDLYPKDKEHNAKIISGWEYVERIKARLHVLQGTSGKA